MIVAANSRILFEVNSSDIKTILELFSSGGLSADSAVKQIKSLSYEDIGHTKVDHARVSRQGFPEVIFGFGKTKEQIVAIYERLIERSPNVLITRTTAEVFGDIRNVTSDAEWHESAKLIRIIRDREPKGTREIAVVTAGTSDIPVAEEAALTAEAMGSRVVRIWDVGVAGVHRIIAQRETLQNASAVIVAAGMEGALPSVVGGLVSVPVIGVPTSIGYGASFGGVAALLGMLNSCSSNVTVVNIDNGFGAGFVASLIDRKAKD